MHNVLLFIAYGWLTLGGALHFSIDVAAQYLRGERQAGPETTLYYGLNSAFSLGQIIFGLVGLWLAWQAPTLLARPPFVALSFAAGLGWLAITFAFMGYWEPKFVSGIFLALLIAVAVTA